MYITPFNSKSFIVVSEVHPYDENAYGVTDETLCYILQYMNRYGGITVIYNTRYECTVPIINLIHDFKIRLRQYQNTSWRRTMFNILQPIHTKQHKDGITGLTPYMIRDGIADYLLPIDIFKICMLSHESYNVLHPILEYRRKTDITHRTIRICDEITVKLSAYSNGLIVDNIIVNDKYNIRTVDKPSTYYRHKLWEIYYEHLLNIGIVKYLNDSYVSNNLPHPIDNTKNGSKAGRYLASICNYATIECPYFILIRLACHGFWILSTREWIKELYCENSYDLQLFTKNNNHTSIIHIKDDDVCNVM